MLNKLEFLTSVRFWKLIASGVVYVLSAYGLLEVNVANAIIGVLGASVIIRTVDRSAELLK